MWDTPACALSFLVQQHDEADVLFDLLLAAQEPSRRRTLLAELTLSLTAHMQLEEQLFYPAVFAPNVEDELREANEDHLSIKNAVLDLVTLRLDDPQFAAKVRVAMEQASHHAREEEEGELFPRIRARVAPDQLQAFGLELAARYKALRRAASLRSLAGSSAQRLRL
ncbi:MAG: hemerythrin domain-containing protein [Kofleriaceae bacterium]